MNKGKLNPNPTSHVLNVTIHNRIVTHPAAMVPQGIKL
jgi:hypothetical protein